MPRHHRAPEPRRHLSPRPRTALALVTTLVAAAVLTTGLVGPVGAADAATALTASTRLGPAPTGASITAERGRYAVAHTSLTGGDTFRAAHVYYPSGSAASAAARQRPFGVVAFSPGFLSTWDQMSWLGPRLASRGFVVVAIDTKTPADLPAMRADQLLAALAAARRLPALRRTTDFSRVAMAGWSMGGGAALDNAARGRYKAVIAITPWEREQVFSRVTEPTLIIGGQKDTIAPVADHSVPFYRAVRGRKAYVEIADGDHFFTLSPNITQATLMIAWLEVYVNGDTRYRRFICRPVTGTQQLSVFTTSRVC